MTDDYERIRRMLLNNRADRAIVQGTAMVPVLIRALKDSEKHVRENAAYALGVIKSVSAVPALIAALKDKEELVQGSAAGALVKIGLPAVPALIDALNDRDERRRCRIRGMLVAVGEAVLPQLVAALKDRNLRIRGSAALTLGLLDDASTVPPLIAALKDKSPVVRGDVVLALAEIGNPAIPAVIGALKDKAWRVRNLAAGALAKVAEITEIDLRAVRKVLTQYVDSVKEKGDGPATKAAEKEALGHYLQISKGVGKRLAKKYARMEDGVILVGERPRPPSGRDRGTYRQGARALA